MSKKVVLYGTSARVVYGYGMKVVEKMERIFETFRENQDEVALLWRPDAQSEMIHIMETEVLWEMRVGKRGYL